MRLPVIMSLLCASTLLAQNNAPWVAKSNENTQILLRIMAKYAPESAGQIGITGLDEQITVPSADTPERVRADLAQARRQLQERLAAEHDPLVKQDLEILIESVDKQNRA